MKHTKLQRVLSVFLAVIMLAGTLTALPVSAAKPEKAPASKIDVLFTEEGYGLDNYTADSAAGAGTCDNFYRASGIYYRNNANAKVVGYTKGADGKLTAGGTDYKLQILAKMGFFDPRAVNVGMTNLEEARYLDDILCSDVGYSKYTLEMDVAINNTVTGTYDSNDTKQDFSPYRGFSLLYLYNGGWVVKATGVGIGSSIEYDTTKLYKKDSETSFTEDAEGAYVNVTKVDTAGAVADRGYLYTPSTSSSYFISDYNDTTKALGTKKTETFDIGGAIDFNKISAAGLAPVSYYTGVEKTLKLVFTVDQKDGADNDVYNVEIFYDGNKIGNTSYTVSAAHRKNGIQFSDISAGVTLDNIRLTVDETSEFRTHDNLTNYGDLWSNSYWDDALNEGRLFKEISNTPNNFSAVLYCKDCTDHVYVKPHELIANNIKSVVGANSLTVNDSKGIVKGNNDFWVATDIHTEVGYAAPAEAKTLLKIGGAEVLKLGTDGKLALGDGTAVGNALVAKNSYTVAVRVMPDVGKYQVYVDSQLVGTAALTVSSTAITFSSLAGMRLLNNKALTLTATGTYKSPELRSINLAKETDCTSHVEANGSVRTFHKFPSKLLNPEKKSDPKYAKPDFYTMTMAYSYICAECGQRTYTELGEDVVTNIAHDGYSPDNTTAYSMNRTTAMANDEFMRITAPDDTFASGAAPLWISFDYTVNILPSFTKTDTNMLNFMTEYSSVLRYYKVENTNPTQYDLCCKAQGGAKIVTLKAGETYKFAIRITPKATSGTAEIYINGALVGTYTGNIRGTSPNSQIRMGMYGAANIANLAVVKEAHDCKANSTVIFDQGKDTITQTYTCCGKTNYKKINGMLADNLANVNDGFETVSFKSNKDYWVATDINVRAAVKDGALITLGSDKVLEIKDGKLTSGAWVGAAVASPTTYSVAANIKGTAYDLYIDDKYVTSGTLSASEATATVTFGCEDFGYDVRFNYNKIVGMGNVTATPKFVEDKTGTVCYHIGTEKVYEDFSTKLVPEKENGGNPNSTTNVNLLYTTYICKGCGERVYNAEQGENLHNVDPVYYNSEGKEMLSVYNSNDAAYNGNTLNAMSIQNGSFLRSGVANIYTNKDIVGNPESDYWFSFSFDMTEIKTEEPRKNNGEANFLNIMVDYTSLLRLYTVPNTVTADTPISSFKTYGKDFGITDAETCSKDFLLLRSKKTGQNVGLLYVGAHYDITIHVVNGVADVYVNDKLTITNATFLGTPSVDKVDRPYSFRFFDKLSGKYQFTNYAFVRDADSYVNFDGKGVIEADVTHTATEGATTYTNVFSVDNKALLSVNDANGELVVPNGNGYTSLYDSLGNKIVVGAEATKIGLVNNGGKFNYYVNGVLARTAAPTEGAGAVYAQDLEPVAKAGMREIKLGDGVILTDNYGIGGSGTAEYIGEQMRTENEVFQNQIRIVAGLNSLYHGNVGFKVTNITNNKEITALNTDSNVYSSLLADSEKVYATDYGYNYFSLFEIKDINTTIDSTNEISIIPYTTVGNNISYGEEKIITIKVANNVLTIE